MENLNFTPNPHVTLTLATDGRINQPDYTNDQIWEVNFGNSEPPSLALQTTFGLRTKMCRIFPRFILDGKSVVNPTEFYQPIIIHRYYPNYIFLSFNPFSTIDVKLEYWVPNSQVITCRSSIFNNGMKACKFQVEWAELLVPSVNGTRMSVKKFGFTNVLSGSSENLFPVLFLTGAIQAGKSSYPSLNLSCEIPAQGSYAYRWVHASLSDVNASYDQTKEIINKNWEAEFAKITRINSGNLEITTGDIEWDKAIYLSQVTASQLILGPTEFSPSPSFVLSRNPDQGYSTTKDGSDYSHLWNGQTALDAYYLTNYLLPDSPELLKGILNNFFDAQLTSGEIDWKPGLGGQRSQLLCTPLLATLAWRLYENTKDIEYLKKNLSHLLSFFFSWFSKAHDRDGDEIPEWDQTIQTGYEENPLFSFLYPWSIGLDISCIESPDLVSYLYQECQALISLASQIPDDATINKLNPIANILKNMILQSWNNQLACNFYRDRDSHFVTPAVFLGKLIGPGTIEIHQEYSPAIRPIIHIKTVREGTLPIQVYIHGITMTDVHRVEHIPANNIHWHPRNGFATSEYNYKSIEQIQVTGASDDVELIVQAGCQKYVDQTLTLPLWAGILSEDQAKIMIDKTIMNEEKFLGSYGLRSCYEISGTHELPDELSTIYLLFLNLIVEGLLRYGARKEAADILIRLMKTVVNSIHSDMKFHQFYHSETGKPSGTINSLTSLIPRGLILQVLGVKIYNTDKVEINGRNPFPWPVTVRFHGLTVVQQEKKALIIFPDGQKVSVDNSKPQIIHTS